MANILFKITGSIAVYKICDVIFGLVKNGHTVQVAASESALKFVGKATFEALTGRKVMSDTFANDNPIGHIEITQWSDLTILAPATANTINKLAAGIGDNLITTMWLAHDFNKPYLIAPAMNTKMYYHPATIAARDKLDSWGVYVLPTQTGRQACGDIGLGNLLKPRDIVNIIKTHLE